MVHNWQPTDTQGYHMECLECEIDIVLDTPEWDKEVEAACFPKKVSSVLEAATIVDRSNYIDKHIMKIAKICGKRDELHQIAIIGCMKAHEQGFDDPTDSIHAEIGLFLDAQKSAGER
jgi:ribulose 1,5-bisphosphate synthetase/thiazole synthase